jgi:quinol-cytochrome oxidoreductase complex cytochrome b subunit
MATPNVQTKPWLETRLPLGAFWRTHVSGYLTARDQPYLATLPGLILGALIFLAVSGAVLSVFYVAAEGSAFDSIQFISRSVNFGWLIHSFHSTGTTLLFAAVYLLLFRGILGSQYKGTGDLVWFLELKLFILLLAVGYLGYVLADGATSYWSLHNAALAGARLGGAPGAIADWIFGGPAGPGTLARMVVFHVVLALLLFAVVGALLIARRTTAPPVQRKPVALHPYYTAQYFTAFVIFALIFAILVFFAPHLGENRLNLAAANPLVVPDVLTPPWYLLPIAAIGSVLPSTLGGVIAVIAGLAVLYALPWLDRSKPGAATGLLYKFLVFILALDVFALAIASAAPPSFITGILIKVFIVWYFLHFLVLTPLSSATPAGGTPAGGTEFK